VFGLIFWFGALGQPRSGCKKIGKIQKDSEDREEEENGKKRNLPPKNKKHSPQFCQKSKPLVSCQGGSPWLDTMNLPISNCKLSSFRATKSANNLYELVSRVFRSTDKTKPTAGMSTISVSTLQLSRIWRLSLIA